MTLIGERTTSGLELPSDGRAIRTPSLGFVELSREELWLIDRPELQRLRRIHQLAFSHYIYPGADHSRFLHTLSMVEIGTLMLRQMQKDAEATRTIPWDAQEWDRIVRLFRLATIFHDTGHAPFSHAGEGLLPGEKHEIYSVMIVERYQEPLDELFGDGTAADICAILDPRIDGSDPALQGLTLVRELIDGPLDADKLAYLLEDSYFCGVSYGVYDHRRVVETARAYLDPGDGEVHQAVEWGGMHVAEDVILARYKMLIQVYFHRTRRSFDRIFSEFMRRLLERGYPEELDEYLAWDDARVLVNAADIARKRGQGEIGDWARRLIERIPLTTVFDPLVVHMTTAKAHEYVAAVEVLKRDAVAKGIQLFEDRAEKLPHTLVRDEVRVPLVDPDREPSTLIKESTIVRGLTDKIVLWRVYADVRDEASVKSLRKSWRDAAARQAAEVARVAGEED